jgi:hypothetical protein
LSERARYGWPQFGNANPDCCNYCAKRTLTAAGLSVGLLIER